MQFIIFSLLIGSIAVTTNAGILDSILFEHSSADPRTGVVGELTKIAQGNADLQAGVEEVNRLVQVLNSGLFDLEADNLTKLDEVLARFLTLLQELEQANGSPTLKNVVSDALSVIRKARVTNGGIISRADEDAIKKVLADLENVFGGAVGALKNIELEEPEETDESDEQDELEETDEQGESEN